MSEKINGLMNLKTSSKKIVILLFLLSVALLVGNAAYKLQNVDILKEQERWVKQTMNVMLRTDAIVNDLLSAQSGVRGFVISGNESYLDRYKAAQSQMPEGLRALKTTIGSERGQAERLALVEEKIGSILAEFEEVITVRREQGADAASLLIGNGSANAAVNAILKDLDAIRNVEEESLVVRSAAAEKSGKAVERSVFVSTLFAMFILTLAFLFVNRTIAMQQNEQLRQYEENWIKDSLANLSSALLGTQHLAQFGERLLAYLLNRLALPVGTFYVASEGKMRCLAVQGGDLSREKLSELGAEHGFFKRVKDAKAPVVVNDLPENYLKIAGTFGSAPVRTVLAIPVIAENEVVGVIELGSLQPLDSRSMKLVRELRDLLGVSYSTARKQEQILDLLDHTKLQAEELTTQKEELKSSHEELEAHADAVVMANAELKKQQEQLAGSNEELEQQARALEKQKSDLQQKNKDLIHAQAEIARKASELEQASRYKSEFLANMSHELRTPLNSLLILSTLLAENEGENLTEKQVGFARTINQAGTDLLQLINDILDLSRVEAGKLSLNPEPVSLAAMKSDLEQTFLPQAEQRGLSLIFHIDPSAPSQIRTDEMRLKQVMKNLISNAIKFTKKGSVKVSVESSGNSELPLAIRVADTGVGIPREKFDAIFEEFRQADGSTVREYGGTGLGLAICRKLSTLLGCEITVESEVGKGSVFTLHCPLDLRLPDYDKAGEHLQSRHTGGLLALPEEYYPKREATPAAGPALRILPPGDMPGDITPEDSVILVVEDDARFSQVLVQLAQNEGFKCLLTDDGLTGIELARTYQPRGVLLDIRLPDMSGLSVLDQLKNSPQTRHIPVHIISSFDYSQNAMRMGAVGYLTKPADKRDIQSAIRRMMTIEPHQKRRLLIIEDDARQRLAMTELLKEDNLEIVAVGTGNDAMQKLKREKFDCVILDLYLPDIPGFELLASLQSLKPEERPPVVIYTGKELSAKEIEHLERYAESIIIKGAKSPERLLDEVSLFLHRVEEQLSPTKQQMLTKLRDQRKLFEKRTVLIADDDMRNIYALASALELMGFDVVIGKNGQEALDKLKAHEGIDMVLMDIMMPVMDGYTAMKNIRSEQRYGKLPIIALTAKAMQGDQEKCLEAGANDYLAKPVDLERLVSLMRVWLPEHGLA